MSQRYSALTHEENVHMVSQGEDVQQTPSLTLNRTHKRPRPSTLNKQQITCKVRPQTTETLHAILIVMAGVGVLALLGQLPTPNVEMALDCGIWSCII